MIVMTFFSQAPLQVVYTRPRKDQRREAGHSYPLRISLKECQIVVRRMQTLTTVLSGRLKMLQQVIYLPFHSIKKTS